MNRSRYVTDVVLAALLVLLAASGTRVYAQEVLSGRDLLRVIRDKDGLGQMPAYEDRMAEAVVSAETTSPELPLPPELPPTQEEPEIQTQPVEPVVSNVSTEPPIEPRVDELLKMIPAESLFCMRVNNFDYTLSQIDQFLAGVSPLPMGVSMAVRMNLAKMLGSPELKGVHMGGDFAVFGPLVGTDMSDLDNIGVLVPVTDYKEFVSGNPNVGPPDEQGISRIISEGIHPSLVVQAKNYALVSPQGNDSELVLTAESIRRGAVGLSSALDSSEAARAGGQPVWIYGDIQSASKTFGPLLLGKIEEMKKMMEEAKSSGQVPMGDPAASMEMCATMLQVLMSQGKSLSISVDPKPSVFTISNTLLALPGTDMADMFAGDGSAKQDNRLLGYLQDGAVMNVSGEVTAELNAKSMDLFAAMVGKDMSPEDKARIERIASDIATVFGGNDAMSLSIEPNGRPPFWGRYVIEIEDKDRVNGVIEDGAELFRSGCVADLYKNMGLEIDFTINRDAATYKGVSIESAKLMFNAIDANSPQAQMISAIYGGGLDYRWAVVDELWLCTFGSDVDSTMRGLIDLVQAGGPKQTAGEVKAALTLLPEAETADFFATFNYVRVLKVIPAIMGAMMPVPMPQMDIPTRSSIVFAGRVGGGKMTIDIALPKEHLTEIMAVFQVMMQQQDNKCRVTQTRLNLMTLHSAVTRFKMDTGRYPTREEGLQALVEQPGNVEHYEAGGYLETGEVPKDGWGNDFVYQLYPESGKPFVIISYGADGKAGGEGYNRDLYSTDPQ